MTKPFGERGQRRQRKCYKLVAARVPRCRRKLVMTHRRPRRWPASICHLASFVVYAPGAPGPRLVRREAGTTFQAGGNATSSATNN